jgi:hypothetical protein
VVLVLLLWWPLVGHSASGEIFPLDLRVPGLKVVRTVSGDEAISAINRLHGLAVDVVRGVVVHYQAETDVHDKATIWASEARSESQAQEQTDVMMDKMKGNTRSPFKGYRPAKFKEVQAVRFEGLGQAHCVFRKGKWVYWISAQEQGIDDIVNHVCGHP